MKAYRIISRLPDGGIELAFTLACRDDLAALAEGESIAGTNTIEVWDENRLVGRVQAANATRNAQDLQNL